MYGLGDKVHHLHLIDFGLSEVYWSRKHVPMTSGNSMVGTARYCSINTHKAVGCQRLLWDPRTCASYPPL
ncbi:unnamed protein product [Effrenium voratum]|nr:unnamed protein product [Effrenium voratum]